NQLFKNTQLQENFSVNTVALVDGVPRTLNIAQLIGYYVDHQMEVIERRTKFRLDKAEARAHIVAGLLIALDNIDQVVAIIRGSADTDVARAALMKSLKLSEIQASHILDMPLRRLTALETGKLRDEMAELQKLIKYLTDLLKSPEKRRKLIATELQVVRDKFADERRSRIIPDEGDMSLEDLIADEDIVVTVTANGYVKAVNTTAYRRQGRGGRGVKGANLREDDVITKVVHTTAHSLLLFFTNRGMVHRVKAHQLPRQDRTSKGVLAHSVLPLQPDERIEAIIDTRDYESATYLVLVTKLGQIKKSRLADYDSRQAAIIAIRLQEGDEVVAVRTTPGDSDILIFTHDAMGIRFSEKETRSMGRDTMGVRGIKLREGDHVVSAAVSTEAEEVLLLTSGGYGKRTRMSEFPTQKRGGIGVRAIKLTKVRGTLVAARGLPADAELLVTSSDGIVIRTEAKTVSRQKRDASGVKVMNLAAGATISAFDIAPVENGDETG
ncbi:MAG: DNA gyrase subunit A, partial [Acidimicrobiia bacterium]|nr:DNA gyrase subunit A [Acidimicrobiia bacterium]